MCLWLKPRNYVFNTLSLLLTFCLRLVFSFTTISLYYNLQIYIPEAKVDKLKNCTYKLLHAKSVTVERLAQVIGFPMSCLPAFWFGRLNYRALKFLKIDALGHGSYRSKVELSAAAKTDLKW